LAGHQLVIQAGGFGEHRFGNAQVSVCTSEYPGTHKAYAAPTITTAMQTVAINDTWLQVELPPATEMRLDLETIRYCRQPRYVAYGDWDLDAGSADLAD
jgi:hypothetical protein